MRLKSIFKIGNPNHRFPSAVGLIFLLIILGELLPLPFATTFESAAYGTNKPIPAEKGLDADGQMQIQRRDRCPLCAMLPVRYPEYSCALQLKNGETYYFCSPRCLLRVWSNPKRYLNISSDALGSMVVRHYFTGEQIDGRIAIWISGSNVVGPMGPAVIALKNEKEVTAFKKRHGGKRVFRIHKLTASDWEDILGGP